MQENCVGCGSFCFSGGENMPYKPLRPCRHPGCNVLTSAGYCDNHRPRKSVAAATRHAMYSSAVWRHLRQEQLLAEPFCRECAKRGERVRATDVDHITPHGGDWQLFTDENNLQSLCHACHSAKTIRETMENGLLLRE